MARRAALLHFLRSQSKQLSTIRNFHSGYHFCQSGTRPHDQCAKLNFNHATATAKDDNKISIGPRRGKETGEDEKETGVVYYGPISSTIKKVKLLSLSTCCLSVSLGPVVTFMTSQDTNVILKGAVASSVIFFSASTMAALHWFVSPYIHKLRWQPGSDSFEVEMMSWLATFIPKTIKFADIRLPETNRPFVTLKANRNFYFVDSEHCHNKALLNRLTPQKSANESAFKNL
ncbi:transmembrane protein [Salix suchowensis]|nr:transmembrane protein [Salix suchowensis]